MGKTKILIVDNYDSFTYNLKQIIYQITAMEPDIVLNDQLNTIDDQKYTHIFISPGPGLPKESGQLMDYLPGWITQKRIFGVCLGMQAIVEACGGNLLQLNEVQHGIQDMIYILEPAQIFENLSDPFPAGRYHSWIINDSAFPKELIIIARDSKNCPMAIKHTTYPVYAVQFHPESIMTPAGTEIIQNFLLAEN